MFRLRVFIARFIHDVRHKYTQRVAQDSRVQPMCGVEMFFYYTKLILTSYFNSKMATLRSSSFVKLLQSEVWYHVTYNRSKHTNGRMSIWSLLGLFFLILETRYL